MGDRGGSLVRLGQYAIRLGNRVGGLANGATGDSVGESCRGPVVANGATDDSIGESCPLFVASGATVDSVGES